MSSPSAPSPSSKKSGKSKQAPSSSLRPVSKIINLDNQEFITTPRLSQEQKAIYASQVIIPTTVLEKTLGVMGPLISTERLEKTKEFFPVYSETKPIVNKSIPLKFKEDELVVKLSKTLEKTCETETSKPNKDVFNMDYVIGNFKLFRSCPSSDQLYQDWLSKVENKKTQEWESIGILNLIRMSKLGFSYS